MIIYNALPEDKENTKKNPTDEIKSSLQSQNIQNMFYLRKKKSNSPKPLD